MLGFYELDFSGTVKYAKTANDAYQGVPADYRGRNFFDEVAAFDNVEEFRRRFSYFIKGSNPAERFNFTCRFDTKSLDVKVMLTQICEREFDSRNKVVILDIRKG